MAGMGYTPLSETQVQEAFLAGPPLIAENIMDMTFQHPNWLGSIWKLEDWPEGQGTQMEQLVFRGGLPQVERGFDSWKRLGNNTGCNPGQGPDCSYNWTEFGGYGFDRKVTELMSQDFRTKDYCIAEIQTSHQFRDVFGKIMENIYRQVDFYKEQNIGMNFLTMLAKKFIVDGAGAKGNTNNPYVYRNIGTARLSMLNMRMLEFFYDWMRRMPDVIPYDNVDGRPLFALEASEQVLSAIYTDDANIRQDVRFSGYANDLLEKFNFQTTIKGMFIPAPILYPRRFNIVNGEPFEVLPTVNGVPAEVGSYSYLNPDYLSATHEEVLLHGRDPFKIWTQPTATSLGQGTSFGPEPKFLESWKWVNPETTCDPFQRVGYFASSAKIGVSAQFSEGMYAILVERPSVFTMSMYTPNPVCPVAPPDCGNLVPEVTCPCPLISGQVYADPMNANTWYVPLITPIEGDIGDDVTLQLNNGLGVAAELAAISADLKTISLTFTEEVDQAFFDNVVGILCATYGGCSSTVNFASDCRSNQTGQVKLALQRAIRAVEEGDIVLAYFGDCTTAELAVVSVDAEKLVWTVEYAAGAGPSDDPTGAGYTVLSADMICDRKGIAKLCVPPSTDASCPACEFSITACSDS
jgi:hypothetical protein